MKENTLYGVIHISDDTKFAIFLHPPAPNLTKMIYSRNEC